MPGFSRDDKVVIVLLCMVVLIRAAVHLYMIDHAPVLIPEDSLAEKYLVVQKKVNINIADKEELLSLNGIGPSLAENIIAYRKEKGAFKSKEGMLDVKGIGPAKFAKIKDLIIVGGGE